MSPNSTCDLHLHTYYSDGRASPAEVLHNAASIGLRTVAITDHDNVNGFPEAAFVADELGLELIPGVELTTFWEHCSSPGGSSQFRQEVDLLGYFIDPQDAEFQDLTRAALDNLRDRITKCCALLTQSGFPIDIYDVLDENHRYPGPMQLITALWHKGYADSWNTAFPIFAEYWRQVPHCDLRIEQAISAIHAAGGVAVLAHPVSVNCADGWIQPGEMASLAAMGLDGLEICHPRLNAEARHHFQSLAEQLGLLVSGGSDEHGWPDGFVRMGTEPVAYAVVQKLRERSRFAQES